ncbi:hypothetical protein [Frigoriflavimonas asaccharolytica]|uniref:Uncharacterized protein n=1 Tax=Frigoriflavimonas asaccharolytica TaxID=2735899 RepID=A0A8J8GC17_9FLAO|nr:hypothetical protein [Frigoriflavimonas asaccharolytica]NRS93190.1 hypothetical protein [Frigoriflavimonas asaccharolytica]
MNKLFFSMGLLVGSMSFGTNVASNPSISEGPSKEINSIKTIESNSMEEGRVSVEYRTITHKNLPPTCEYRTCNTKTVQNADGSTTEYRICSEWIEVACPTTGPQAPTMSTS